MSLFFNPNGLNAGNIGGGGTPIDIPVGSTLQKGVVQLKNDINLDSDAFAATSKAVHDAVVESNSYTDLSLSKIDFFHIGSNPPDDTNKIWIEIT